MPVMAVKGYIRDADMKPEIRKQLKPIVPFRTKMNAFKAAAAPKAQSGTDYDIPNEPPAYDQGDIGSCVLNATCGALNTVLAVEGQTTAMLSRLFLYWLCRYAMGTLDQDSGTYTHLAVDRVGKIGVPNESLWAYQDSNLYLAPPPECYPEASDNKAAAWYQIMDPVAAGDPARLDQLETSIRSNHPAIFGTPVSSAIQAYQAGQVLTIPNLNDLIGGHAMCVTGIRYINGARCWRIRNSWSTAYGDDGHLLIDDAYMSWVQLNDIWVLTRMDALLF
jgi:hypothetical protein